MNIRQYITFILSVLLFASCSNFEKVRKSEDFTKKLEAAYQYYEDEKYDKSSILFDETLPMLRGRSEAEKAQFHRAMSYYNSGQFFMSAYYFRDFFETYPRSEYAEQSLFMRAKSLSVASPGYDLDQESTYQALGAVEMFTNRFPQSEYKDEINEIADELTRKLEVKAFENAKYYYKLGDYRPANYRAAVIAFNNFARNYPASEYNEEAGYLKIQSQYYYAENSTRRRQEERFLEVIEYYEDYIQEFPESPYIKAAEQFYQDAVENVKEVRS